MKTTAVAALLLGGLLTSASAFGAGEGEWQLALRAGPGNVSVDGRKSWGLATALEVDYGLSDAWAVRATLAGSVHPVDTKMVENAPPLPGGTVRTVAALAGLTYTIDVLRLIPYANVQLGAIRFAGAVVDPRTVFAAELGIGADYFLSRRWTTGVSFQYLFAPEDLLSDPLNLGSSPFFFSATWRVSRIF
jgi:outer membrane protein W